jgi:hypothetical protein
MSMPLAGGPPVTLAVDPNVTGPLAIDCPQPPGACQATWVYWTGGSGASLLKVPAGGGSAVTLVSVANSADIVTDSTSVYFTNTVRRPTI